MIISITGYAGSGKTVTSELLVKKLNFGSYYMGGLMRERAAELGMNINEYFKSGEQNQQINTEIDERVKRLGEIKDNFIIQSRTAWYFIPHSFKIFLKVDLYEAATRVYNYLSKSSDRNEDMYSSIDDAKLGLQARMATEKKQYNKYYGIDSYDERNFDLVIDTTKIPPEEVVERIIAALPDSDKHNI